MYNFKMLKTAFENIAQVKNGTFVSTVFTLKIHIYLLNFYIKSRLVT